MEFIFEIIYEFILHTAEMILGDKESSVIAKIIVGVIIAVPIVITLAVLLYFARLCWNEGDRNGFGFFVFVVILLIGAVIIAILENKGKD